MAIHLVRIYHICTIIKMRVHHIYLHTHTHISHLCSIRIAIQSSAYVYVHLCIWHIYRCQKMHACMCGACVSVAYTCVSFTRQVCVYVCVCVGVCVCVCVCICRCERPKQAGISRWRESVFPLFSEEPPPHFGVQLFQWWCTSKNTERRMSNETHEDMK